MKSAKNVKNAVKNGKNPENSLILGHISPIMTGIQAILATQEGMEGANNIKEKTCF